MNARCHLAVLFAILTIPMAGCCHLGESAVPKPQPLTLDEALKSVVTGLYAMEKAEKPADYKSVGLIPSDAEVVFKITASDSEKKRVYVELTAGGSTLGGKAGGEHSQEAANDRSNTITVHFKNVLFADEKALLAVYDDKKLGELFKKLGWVILAN